MTRATSRPGASREPPSPDSRAGAGIGGLELLAALSSARGQDADIILMDKGDGFVFPETRTTSSAAVAGNEVGITCAHGGAQRLSPAHLCAGFTCGNMGTAWRRGCGCTPGGQGVAGSPGRPDHA